jgi:hypothetical protein
MVVVCIVGYTVVCGVVGGASLVMAVAAVWCHKSSQMLVQIGAWNPCSSACRPRGVRQNCAKETTPKSTFRHSNFPDDITHFSVHFSSQCSSYTDGGMSESVPLVLKLRTEFVIFVRGQVVFSTPVV